MYARTRDLLAALTLTLLCLAPLGAVAAPCAVNTCTTAPAPGCVGDAATSWSSPGSCDDLTGTLAIRDLAMVAHTPSAAEPEGRFMREPLVVHGGTVEMSVFARNVFQGSGRVGTQTSLTMWVRVNDGAWSALAPSTLTYAARGTPGGAHEDHEYWQATLDVSALSPGDRVDYVLEAGFSDRDTTWLYRSAAGMSARTGDEATAKARPWTLTAQFAPGEIPTLSEWALILLMLSMLVLAWRRLSRAVPGAGPTLMGLLLFVVMIPGAASAADEPLYVPATWNAWADGGADWGAAASARNGGVWRISVAPGAGGPATFKVTAADDYATTWSDTAAGCAVGTPCVVSAGDGGETPVTLGSGKVTTVSLRPSGADLEVAFWQTASAPVSVTSVTPPAAPVDPGAEVAFTLALSASLPLDQYVYLHSSDDGWATATVSAASCAGASCEVTITIPEDPDAANALSYYGFVSAAAPGLLTGAGALDPELAALTARRYDCDYPVAGSVTCAGGDYCSGGACLTPACDDGLENGDETDEDCGGSCPDCGDGLGCDTFLDCLSGVCSSGECQAPTCFDGVRNGDETGVDSGGSCGTGIPPDPATVAPELDATVPTGMAASVAFLYAGDSPSQTGVVEGAIDEARVAVLRGAVYDGDGAALSGVTISVLGQEELGTTRSRDDGGFDLAVNGGARLQVVLEADGYLSAQRQVAAGWEEFVQVPDVWMVPLDPASTEIDLQGAGAMQVAQGSVVTDDDGSRQATVLFTAGTTGSMTLPDGSSQALDAATVRVTEFTVGENGPERMPAALPPASAYTWAAEFSVDEAQAAGASRVSFDPPLVTYVDNFLGFAVGGVVPTGYYDRELGAWVPSANGRVVGIVSITGGLVDLDLDGDGASDDAAALAALGVTDAERAELAGLYAAGQSFWRVPMAHFTPFDCNWPHGPPEDAEDPAQDEADRQDDESRTRDCDGEGSVIGCYRQTLGEDIGITGTGYSLHYRSHRTPGYQANEVEIPLTGESIPDSLEEVVLEIEVAGQEHSYSHEPATDLSQTFTWDGLDVYGRTVTGRQTATVRIGYVYTTQYYEPGTDLSEAFGQIGSSATTVTTREDTTIWQEYDLMLGSWDARGVGLGGWTVSAQHVYDADEELVYLGTGRELYLEGASTTAAGMGTTWPGCYNSTEKRGSYQDGGAQATEVCMHTNSVAMGADGSMYLATSRRIQRVDTDGSVTTIGMHSTDYTALYGEVPPADLLLVDTPWGIAVDADGGVYYGERDDDSLRYLSPEGVISIVAGGPDATGYGFEDGEEATAKRFHDSEAIALGPDGSIYVAEEGTSSVDGMVYRISPAGRVYHYAGGGSLSWDQAEGELATEAALNEPEGLAIAEDGTLYVSERKGHRVRRVDTDGSIHTIAGKAGPGMIGDDGPAVDAKLNNPSGLALAGDGSLYIHDAQKNYIRRISSDGVITRFAGDGTEDDYPGDGTPPLQVPVDGYGPTLAIGSAGTLYLVHPYRVLAFGGGEPEPEDDGDLLVPSRDGAEVYRFDADGRHLETLDAITGRAKVTLGYDGDGLLVTLTDGGGRVTTIARDAAGAPTAITDKYGVATALVVNGADYLEEVTNPAGETHEMIYSADGLLTTFTRPSGHATGFTYDSEGRLQVDSDPAGGSKTLTRSDDDSGFEVTVTTGEGGVTTHRQEVDEDDTVTRTLTDPNGLDATLVKGPDGARVTTYADGSSVTVGLGPDPRFFMSAPIVTSLSESTPGGLTRVTTRSRAVTLSDSADILSLATLTDTVDVNGDVTTTAWDGDARTLALTRPSGLATVLSVNADGRVTTVAAAGLTSTSLSYDGDGRLGGMSRGGQSLSVTYDGDGRMQTLTDALSQTTTYAYDAAGRVTTITHPDGRAVGLGYDANGNLTTVTPPARPDHTFGYSALDLETSHTTPAVGGASAVTTRGYDLDRRLTSLTRPDGEVVSVTYDAGGRVATVTTPDETLTHAYHATSGHLASISGADADLAYTYDGPLVTGETWSGDVALAVTHGYDADLHLASLQVGAQPAVALSYDGDDRITTAGAESLSYAATHGLLAGTSLGSVTTTATFDGLGLLATEAAVSGATALYSQSLTRDDLGRVVTKVEIVAGVTTTTVYGYDDRGRLETVTVDGALDTSYGYDDNGNRASAVTSGGSVAGACDDQDRLLSYGTRSYTHTDNGEVEAVSDSATGGTTSYTYDAFGDLRSATLPDGRVVTYLHDASLRRVAKEIDGIRERGFVYLDGFRPLAELDGSGAVASVFVYASRWHVPDYLIKGSTTYRILCDHLGSPRRVVDTATGAVVQEMTYDAFGGVLSDTNPGFQPFGFAGGIYDADTGLVLFGWRSYDPVTGRWTSRDPIAFKGGDPNLYAYVRSDPVNLIDPLGLYTGSAGFGFSINVFGLSASIGAGVVHAVNETNGEDDWGTYLTIASGIEASTSEVSFGLEFGQSDNDCIDDLSGDATNYGASAGAIGSLGYERAISDTGAAPVDTFSIGVGGGASAGVKRSKTFTWGQN